MKLADVVATSRRISSTRSRRAKVAGLAELLSRALPEEIEIVVGFLSGVPRQGRVGVGAASLWAVKAVPNAAPELAVLEVDGAIGQIPGITGRGSRARRHALLEDLLGRATVDEQDFLRRLLTGELRQGALEGLMMDAVAAASGIEAGIVRRASMLGGELGSVAVSALSEGEAALSEMRIRPLPPRAAHAGRDIRIDRGRYGIDRRRLGRVETGRCPDPRCIGRAARWRCSPVASTRSPPVCRTLRPWWPGCPSRRWFSTGRP